MVRGRIVLASCCEFVLCDGRIDPRWLDNWDEGIRGSVVVLEVDRVRDDMRETLQRWCVSVLQGAGIRVILVELCFTSVKS